MKPTAHINDWLDCDLYLIGRVEGHQRQGEFNEPLQQTSLIVNRGDGWVETQNTRYILGTPFQTANDPFMLESYGGTD